MSIFFTFLAFIVLITISYQMITVKTWHGDDIEPFSYGIILFLWGCVFIYSVTGPYTINYFAELDRQYEEGRQKRIEAMEQSRKDYMEKHKYYYPRRYNEKVDAR